MTHRTLIFIILLVSSFSQTSFAQNFPDSSEEALSWLEKIAAAPRQQNYVGTFIYYADGHLETSRIVHMVDEGGEHEKIEVLDGLPRIVFRNNDEMKCYLPESKQIVTERRWFRKFFPDLLPRPFSNININDNYFVKKGDQERVTGRKCQVIILKPRDNLRYGHKFWVDTNTGLLLKAAVTDGDQIIEQFAFANLELGAAVNSELLKPHSSLVEEEWQITNLMTSVLKKDELEWQIKNLPPGFKKVVEMKRNLAGKSVLVDHIALSDGLATVSVFIEPILENSPPPVPGFYSSRGAINIYVRTIDQHKVTTVGEVPLETIKILGDAVKHTDKSLLESSKH